MGFGVGSEGDGSAPVDLGSQLQNVSSAARMQLTDGGSRNFNTGVSTSNFSSINANFVQTFSQRFTKDDTQPEMLVFIERSVVSARLGLKCMYEMPSIHALNMYLISPEGRILYGNRKTCEKLMDDFAFAGSMNTTVPSYVSNERDFDSGVVMGRRARCCAVTRAYSERCAATTDRLLDNVYLLVVRRKILDKDIWDKPNSDSVRGSYYWSYNMYVSESKAPPPAWLYIDDDSIGTYIRVGHIMNNTPSNETNGVKTRRARLSLSGKYNLMEKERDFLKLCPLLPTVDICMGVN